MAADADVFTVLAPVRFGADAATGLRAVFGAGTRPDFGTGRGRCTLVALMSTALRIGLGATASPEVSVSNGVRRRFARSPDALAAPAASTSAPEPVPLRFLGPPAS